MLLGLQVPDFTWPGGPEQLGPTFRRIAADADAAGLASFWVMDHFFQIGFIGPPEREMLEGYTALAFAAAATERIALGTLVTGVTYRHPGILIKTVTTLDVLSGGRAWLGIGAAWNEEEHAGLGVPFPHVAERFERLEETLKIAHQMWDGNEGPVHGTHYQLQRPLNSPPPVRRPPILVGGSGEQKTLRFVARYADACNLFDYLGPEVIGRKLAVLREHCAAEGRDYAGIQKTTLGSLALSTDGAGGTLTPAQAVERFGRLAEVGVDHAIVSVPGIHDPASLELFPDLVTELAKIMPAGR